MHTSFIFSLSNQAEPSIGSLNKWKPAHSCMPAQNCFILENQIHIRNP